jgi:hypothetical protein
VAYWAVAQLQPNRTALALQMLVQGGFTVYAPKLRERRTIRGRREDSEVPLFPGYAFVAIEGKGREKVGHHGHNTGRVHDLGIATGRVMHDISGENVL